MALFDVIVTSSFRFKYFYELYAKFDYDAIITKKLNFANCQWRQLWSWWRHQLETKGKKIVL